MGFFVFVLAAIAVVQFMLRAHDLDDVAELRRRVEDLERERQPETVRAAAPPLADEAYAKVEPEWVEPPAGAPTPPVRREAAADWTHVSQTFAEHDAETFAPVPDRGPRERSLAERIIAEHALALVGGLFVLVAAIFFVTYAIDQGWIGPRLRIALAVAFGAALVAAGMRVAARLTPEERAGRAIGSLHGVLAGTGAAVAYLAIVAAVRLEEVMSTPVGVLAHIAITAGVVALARSWRSQDLAAFGMGVGLAAPILVGATATAGTVALLTVALVASVTLAVIERWPRLLLAAMLITAPQLADAGATGDPQLAGVVAMLIAWWALLVAGAIASALRTDSGAARSVVTLILATPLAAAVAFEAALDSQFLPVDGPRALFLLTLALANLLAAGVVHVRFRGRADVLVIALLGAGMSSLAALVGDVGDGAAVAAAWLAEAVALAAVWWHTRSRMAAAFASAIAALAISHVAFLDAPVTLLVESGSSLTEPLLALAAVLLAALAARVLLARLAGWTSDTLTALSRTFDVLAPFAAWYAIAIALAHLADPATVQLQLAAWFAIGGLVALAAHHHIQRVELLVLAMAALVGEFIWLAGHAHGDGTALWVYVPAAVLAAAILNYMRSDGELALLATASQALLAAVVVGWVVPVTNLRVYDEPDLMLVLLQLGAGVIALGALLYSVGRWDAVPEQTRRAIHAAAALGALYAVSVLVVAALTPRPGVFEQTAQLTLTLTWLALGVAALFAGTSQRLRQHVELRVGAYALLGLAAAKLVLVDTADLETPQRMLAFLVTGLGLLGSAALEQRMRGGDLRR